MKQNALGCLCRKRKTGQPASYYNMPDNSVHDEKQPVGYTRVGNVPVWSVIVPDEETRNERECDQDGKDNECDCVYGFHPAYALITIRFRNAGNDLLPETICSHEESHRYTKANHHNIFPRPTLLLRRGL
jgi:hypothetical protein